MKKLFLVYFSILFSTQAYSYWDDSVAGKIAAIDITSGENYGFRVVLEGRPKLCGNGHDWAYINESQSNYQTYVSVLLTAMAAGNHVRLFTKQKGGNGYCNIGYITMSK